MDLDLDFHGGSKHGVEAAVKNEDVPDADAAPKINRVERCGHDLGPRVTHGHNGSAFVDEGQHPTAEDGAPRVGVFRQHDLRHLDEGVGDEPTPFSEAVLSAHVQRWVPGSTAGSALAVSWAGSAFATAAAAAPDFFGQPFAAAAEHGFSPAGGTTFFSVLAVAAWAQHGMSQPFVAPFAATVLTSFASAGWASSPQAKHVDAETTNATVSTLDPIQLFVTMISP
jgi:hypothetical protein